jgi:hypothetical protein
VGKYISTLSGGLHRDGNHHSAVILRLRYPSAVQKIHPARFNEQTLSHHALFQDGACAPFWENAADPMKRRWGQGYVWWQLKTARVPRLHATYLNNTSIPPGGWRPSPSMEPFFIYGDMFSSLLHSPNSILHANHLRSPFTRISPPTRAGPLWLTTLTRTWDGLPLASRGVRLSSSSHLSLSLFLSVALSGVVTPASLSLHFRLYRNSLPRLGTPDGRV